MMAKEKQLYVYIFCSQKIHETFRFQQPMSKGTKRSKMSELFFTYNMYLLWLRSLALGLGFFSPSAHYCGCGSESIRFLVHNKTQWSAIINGCMIRLNNRIMFEAILSHLMFNGCLILVSHISKRVLFFFLDLKMSFREDPIGRQRLSFDANQKFQKLAHVSGQWLVLTWIKCLWNLN